MFSLVAGYVFALAPAAPAPAPAQAKAPVVKMECANGVCRVAAAKQFRPLKKLFGK